MNLVERKGPRGRYYLTGAGKHYLRLAWADPSSTLPQIAENMGMADHKSVYRLARELNLGTKVKKKDFKRLNSLPPPEPKVKDGKRLHKGQTDHWPEEVPRFEDHQNTIKNRLGAEYVEGEA